MECLFVRRMTGMEPDRMPYYVFRAVLLRARKLRRLEAGRAATPDESLAESFLDETEEE